MALANLAIRFLVELGGVAAVGYWGFQVSGDPMVRTAAGIGTAALLIVIWGAVLAPRARSPLSPQQRTNVGTVVLLSTAVALAVAGQPILGLAFGLVTVVNAALLVVLPEPGVAAAR